MYLDSFLNDVMIRNNFRLKHVIHRKIDQKMTPFLINRMGAKKSFSHCHKPCVKTMHSEYILAFRKI